MAQFIFDGKRISQPGVYAEVKSGVNNPPLSLPFGNVLIIDKDPLSFHGNGAGIAGEATSGKQSIYSFSTISSFQNFIGGGLFYDLARPLFRPFGGGANGVSNLFYLRALTTVGATLSLAFDAGTITLKAKNEGISGNGVLSGTKLTRGYSARLEAGVLDPTKFILKLYRGGFKGNDDQGRSFDDIVEADSNPQIVSQSPEISTIEELIQWTTEDGTFVSNFIVTVGAAVTGAIIAADLTAFTTNQLFAGGTSAYDSARVTEALQAIKDANISYVLSTDKEVDATSIDNNKIATFLDTEMIDPATLVVAGGNTSGTFLTQSVVAAQAYNSQNVIVVHGGCKILNANSPTGDKEKNILFKTANVVGRLAGLPPQTPLTYKGINISGELHDLTSEEKDLAIANGVLITGFIPELNFYTVIQGINTVQNNVNVVNSDGTSPSISVVRIAKQLVKELRINAIIDLLGNQQNGPNRSTLDTETVRTWVINYLKSQESTPTEDDLIIDSKDVTVEVDQDAYKVSFGFTPNYEVNKIFITANILDDTTQLN